MVYKPVSEFPRIRRSFTMSPLNSQSDFLYSVKPCAAPVIFYITNYLETDTIGTLFFCGRFGNPLFRCLNIVHIGKIILGTMTMFVHHMY